MGQLGIPEIVVILLFLVIYALIVPTVLCIAVRVFVWIADMFSSPEALGGFGAKVAESFHAQRAPAEQTEDTN
jgi:hypothetical protein